MKDLTPVPRPENDLQLMEPMTHNHHVSSGPKISVRKLLYFLRRFWWIPVVTTTLSLGVAVFVFFHTPPIFVSTGSLWETEKLRLPDGADFTDDRNNYLGTQDELLRSRVLREQTLERLRAFNTNPIVTDILQQLAKDDNYLPVGINMIASPASSVYTIQARSANPLFTPVYLQALMESYLDFRKSSRENVSAGTLNSISEAIQRLETDMKTGQDALVAYERSNNFAILQEESIINAQYLAKLKTELSEYQLQMNLLEARELESDSGLAEATNSSDEIFNSLNGSGASSEFAAGRLDAEKQIDLLKLERDRLSKNLRPTHPKIIKLDEDIAQSEKLIEVYHQQNHEQLLATRQALEIKMKNVQMFINEWEAKVSDASDRMATADGLKQNITRNQSMLDRLSSLVQNVDIGRNIDQDNLQILEPAQPAGRSYTEGTSKMMHSVVLGFGFGLVIIVLLALRDDRFNSIVEVAERFGDNVVGQVPEVPLIPGKKSMALLEGNDDRYMFAESYRNLRSALLFLAIDGHRPKTLLVTSAVPDEGKSTVATNLARALALGGSRVLLVDGDLRKGHIHDLLKLQPEPGFSDLLIQPDEPERFVQPTDLPNFAFLSRGGIRRNPGDLFLSPAFDQIIARFREQYDYVLIDSSPVFAADDTSTIAPRVDGTLFVVRSHFSQARVVREALELLFQRQTKVLGLVLNRSDATARSYHFYKYAKYYAQGDTVEADVVS